MVPSTNATAGMCSECTNATIELWKYAFDVRAFPALQLLEAVLINVRDNPSRARRGDKVSVII